MVYGNLSYRCRVSMMHYCYYIKKKVSLTLIHTSCRSRHEVKWPSKNSLFHFHKRCVLVSMILSFLWSRNNASLTPFTCRLISFLCGSNDAPLTYVCFTRNVLGLYIRWWCLVLCPKIPRKNSLIHFHKRCVSVPMILFFM